MRGTRRRRARREGPRRRVRGTRRRRRGRYRQRIQRGCRARCDGGRRRWDHGRRRRHVRRQQLTDVGQRHLRARAVREHAKRRERVPERERVGEAAIAVLFEAPLDRCGEPGRHVGPQRAQRHRRLVEDAPARDGEVRRGEGRRSGEQLVEHDARRPDVAPPVERHPLHLLGRHVPGRSEDVPLLRDRRLARQIELRDAEIEELHDAPPVGPLHDEEVRGLEIAVDDAERVRLREGAARLIHDRDDVLPRHRILALLRERGDVVALQVLEDHVRDAVLQRVDVHHADDVLARQTQGGARLAKHAGRHGRVARERLVQHLDRDGLVEPQVPGLEDDAHPASPEDAFDGVFPADDAIEPRPITHRCQRPLRDRRSVERSRRARQARPGYRSGR